VKIQVARTADVTVKEAAPRLAQQLGAEVIQVIGRTVTLYRHNPAIVRRDGDVAPWKR
jgi:RNA-binding protein